MDGRLYPSPANHWVPSQTNTTPGTYQSKLFTTLLSFSNLSSTLVFLSSVQRVNTGLGCWKQLHTQTISSLWRTCKTIHGWRDWAQTDFRVMCETQQILLTARYDHRYIYTTSEKRSICYYDRGEQKLVTGESVKFEKLTGWSSRLHENHWSFQRNI